MILNRRDFFKAGCVTSAALGLNLFSPTIFKRRLIAQPGDGKKKMIFIFQRGGNDGVNTVIPRGDAQYNTSNRPTLFIPEAQSIDLGNGFAQLHPMMDPIMEIYNNSALNGVDGPGNLAILHRIGYSGQSQSHFDSQQYWENGTPGQPYNGEGMIYRKVAETIDLNENRFAAAAISGSQMVALSGPEPIPALRDPSKYTFRGSASRVRKYLGRLPSTPRGGDGRGLLGLYGGPREAGKPFRGKVYDTGLALADSMSIVQSAVQQGAYTPENGAVYPGGSFGEKLETVAMLMKRTPVQILGVNIGGWDTHTRQGQIYGNHGNLLQNVAEGYRALYRDLQSMWDELVIVTMTEFGRTSKENGSLGTDHAYACVVFVAGGGVKGGVYNCDATTWRSGDMFSERDRYVRRRTDFRAVFAEIFTQHFGDDPALLDSIIPGYSSLARQRPSDYRYLNFLA